MSSRIQKASVRQLKIENTLAHDYVEGELVLEQGIFGRVVERDGIAQGATGMIDIDTEVLIETDQVEATDTFTWADSANNVVFFNPGTTAAGTLEDASAVGNVAVGILDITGTKDANEVIVFKPRADNTNLVLTT